ncbi:hypothetical protein IWQ60_011995 [Tieghemiomyces parasiticus]|uniref:Uncharacterized protein n=1 Tax=Tieghemiomyces parasiticus TaxID=78921 RepID=A0A9W7ZQX6_9FUNG|nr:hypothetical protein IWQ60_011995 [Tieghemiomyces parasiticus]
MAKKEAMASVNMAIGDWVLSNKASLSCIRPCETPDHVSTPCGVMGRMTNKGGAQLYCLACRQTYNKVEYITLVSPQTLLQFTEGKAALAGTHGRTLQAIQAQPQQSQSQQPQPQQSQSQQPQPQQSLVQSTLQPLSKRFTLKEPSRKRTRNNQGQASIPGLQAQVQAQAKVIEG